MNYQSYKIILFISVNLCTMNPIKDLSKGRFLHEDIQYEIKRGAYVILEDDGALYREKLAKGRKRIWSEHASKDAVYDVKGITGTVLMGTSPGGHTWLQWERSACCTLGHFGDWFWYAVTGKNQGPEGASERTEKNPLILGKINF